MTTSDTQAFAQRVLQLNTGSHPELHGFFASGRPISVARAPGRLDVMGGVADYSGSLVLEMPTREAAFVAAQQTNGDDWQIVSLPSDDQTPLRCVTLSRSDLAACHNYAAARTWFRQDPSKSWAAYLAGVVLVLVKEVGAAVDGGMRLLVHSDVPEAKGVSSSAALEVAAMRAVTDQLGIEIDGIRAATLCQIAENRVVGAPCGIMDQMTSAVGRENRLLALLCQPATVQGYAVIPDALAVWGIDSGIRHAVSGSDYTSVRTGAFMGYRMIAALANLNVTSADGDVHVSIDDPRWHGYLANLAPAEFEQTYAQQLPVQMSGAEFLERFAGTSDSVTHVEPDRDYAIRQPTAHPIYENARVHRFRELLAGAIDETSCIELGELMYGSHASYSACGLGSSGTDRLVELVKEAGPAAGLYGAKITGGGSGGTVAVLGKQSASDAIQEIARQYAAESGHERYVFQGSSPGAWDEEVITIQVNNQ
ncbi:MAG: hypothetical protein KDA60_05030 [Planctomycetales bacterium]|nr:hypothetical protein [Planctomycetales bacterium]